MAIPVGAVATSCLNAFARKHMRCARLRCEGRWNDDEYKGNSGRNRLLRQKWWRQSHA